MLRLQQTWYHFYDRAKSGEREINQVLDFFTNEQFIYLNLNNGFAELKIFGRNFNQEMAFIEKNGSIVINLGDLKNFPLAENYTINPKYHVKMQINYLENAKFNYFHRPFTGYETSFEIMGKVQPEFTFNIPLGMFIKPINIGGQSEYLRADLKTSIEIELLNFNENTLNIVNNFYKSKWGDIRFYSLKIDELFYLSFIESFSKNSSDYKLIFGINLSFQPLDFDYSHFPNDDYDNYKFIIKPESYKKILNAPDYCLNTISMGYTVKNKKTYLVFPGIGFLLVASLSIFILTGNFNDPKINMSVPLSCLIVTMSYLGLFLEFSIFKKHEIIYKKFVTLMIALLLVITFIIFQFVIFPMDKPIISMICGFILSL